MYERGSFLLLVLPSMQALFMLPKLMFQSSVERKEGYFPWGSSSQGSWHTAKQTATAGIIILKNASGLTQTPVELVKNITCGFLQTGVQVEGVHLPKEKRGKKSSKLRG